MKKFIKIGLFIIHLLAALTLVLLSAIGVTVVFETTLAIISLPAAWWFYFGDSENF